jgi:TetR/AcrR family transcriptional regulator, mexJK operon transcriptional repressor
MPRAAGQIDVAKNEAILDAAVEVMAERGMGAPLEEIARRAGVSKQTVYNHFGGKTELVQAMCERRVTEITAPLSDPRAVEDPQTALAGYARELLTFLLTPRYTALIKAAIVSAEDLPDAAAAMYQAGPRASRRKLADFLRVETEAGRLACPDAMEAAEFFAGMVVSSRQMACLLGVAGRPPAEAIDRIAVEAARRFLRAYAA